jgi:hypothetical protein
MKLGYRHKQPTSLSLPGDYRKGSGSRRVSWPPRPSRQPLEGLHARTVVPRLLGLAFPDQCPVSQPATAPVLYHAGHQADIHDLKRPLLWLPPRTPGRKVGRHLLPARVAPRRRAPRIAPALKAFSPLPLRLLICLRIRFPDRPGLLRQHRLCLAPQLSQRPARGTAHPSDNTPRAASTITGRTDPYHAGYPIARPAPHTSISPTHTSDHAPPARPRQRAPGTPENTRGECGKCILRKVRA